MELRDKLANFMETQDYQRLLDRQVKAAKEFAGDEEQMCIRDSFAHAHLDFKGMAVSEYLVPCAAVVFRFLNDKWAGGNGFLGTLDVA